MNIRPPCVEEKPLNILFHKNKDYPQRAKGISFFVLVFSIFVYISIFYIFNLSPSLNNTKLWFFVSNTLILIIAADYGVFSSYFKARNNVYDEYYVMHSQAKSATVSSFGSQYPHVVNESVPSEEDVEINPEEKEAISDQNGEHPDDKMETAINSEAESKPNVENCPEKIVEIDQKVDNNDEAVLAVDNEKKLKGTKTYRRSNSEKSKRVVIDESENINIRRSASESEREEEEEEEEEDEYSTMSDEELNRRIEEFIRRFNRQIRLQRAGNFHRI